MLNEALLKIGANDNALCRWENRITKFKLRTNDDRRTKAQ
jgi:hypothetical protein